LKDRLPFGKVGAIVAPGGTGKSQLLLQLGVSVAAGLPFLEFWEVPERGGVLMLLAEDDEQEIHHRLHNIHAMVSARYPSDNDLTKRLESNLYVRSMVGEHNLMTAAGHNGEVQSTGYAQRVVLTAKEIPNLKIIIIDPASRFRGGIENSAEDVTRFIEELEYMKKQTGASVLVAHHANKGSMNATEANQNASRGSSAFSDGVRWQMNLATLSREDAGRLKIADERRHFYLTASIVKNNYAAPSDAIHLQRKDQGYLEKVDLGFLAQVSDIGLLNKVKEVLRFNEKAGERYTRTSFEDKYGGTDGYLKIAYLPLREKLNRWVADGKLFEEKKKLKADAPMPSRCPAPSGKKLKKLNS
jgi:RecA-family ATPase